MNSKRLNILITLVLGSFMFLTCNKDSQNSNLLIGTWTLDHFEYTTTTGNVLIDKLDDGESFSWTFSNVMVSYEEITKWGKNSSTYPYAYEDGIIVMNTFFKTLISESNVFKVEKLSKTELVLSEVWGEGETGGVVVNGEHFTCVKVTTVYKR